MSLLNIIQDKQNVSKVHSSEYIRTENASDGDTKPEESTKPEQPKAE